LLLSSIMHRAAAAAPVLAAAAFAVKARYVTTDEHSAVLAMCSLGPWQCLKAVPWRLEFFLKLRPLAGQVETLAGEQLRRQWKPRPQDVVVAVPPKSGTTLLLQVTHQLRRGGVWLDDEFEDQTDIIPQLEGGPASLLPQNDINKDQVASPRLFKSHLRFRSCPEDVKRIYCFRDIKDVLVSDWAFTASILESDVPLDSYAFMRVVPGGVDRALKDLCDWWEHRHDPQVCLLFFDDLLEDRFECVRRLQRFLDLEEDPGLASTVAAQSSHEFMSRPENHSKFDDHKIVQEIDRLRGLRRSRPLTGKVRHGGGRSGQGAVLLPDSVQSWIDWRWKCIVQHRLGFANPAEMRAVWAREREEGGKVTDAIAA
ncbi:SULT4A1, partial [Symbiodinium sp. CCMP2592]